MKSSVDKYFEGYEKTVHTLENGKKKTDFVYVGNYQHIVGDKSTLNSVKLWMTLYFALYAAFYILGAFTDSVGAASFVGMISLLILIPMAFWFVAWVELLTAKEYMVSRKYQYGLKRLNDTLQVVRVCSVIQLGGQIICMIMKHQAMFQVGISRDIHFLGACILQLVFSQLALNHFQKFDMEEIPNAFVDEKTGTLKEGVEADSALALRTFEKELEVAKYAAVEAGKLIMEVYESDDFQVEHKEDDSPLTRADKKSNECIVKILRDKFPEYAILSEEEQDDLTRLDNKLCFVVDPLDGTKEFIKRNGQFTVNIALAYEGVSVMGVIYVPVTGELYYASRGQGSYLKTEGQPDQKLSVTDTLYEEEHPENLRVVMSGSHGAPEMEELIEKYHLSNVVRIGSSLKGCLVAKGDAEFYYRHNPTMEWDTAAMQCIAEEAGAIFRQMDDSPMRYNRTNTRNDKGFYIINREENRLR